MEKLFIVKKGGIMKQRTLLTIVFVALITIILTGCGKKGLIGDWAYYNGSSKNDTIYYTFKDEKNGSYTFGGKSRNFTYTDDGTKLTILYDGDTMSSTYEYKLEDDTFTIKDSFGSDVVYKRK